MPLGEIDRRGYRSVGPDTERQLVGLLKDFTLEQLCRVPGVRSARGPGPRMKGGPAPVPRFDKVEGLLIPIRDERGRVLTAQVRAFSPWRPKYQFLSRGRASAHVPLGVAGPCPRLRVTEGPLKADLLACLAPAVPTVAVTGVGSWRAALPALERLGAREVLLAFDADWRDKAGVARSLLDLGRELRGRGLAVSVEVWDAAHGKGRDDLLAGGREPDVVPFADLEGGLMQAASPKGDEGLAPAPPSPGRPGAGPAPSGPPPGAAGPRPRPWLSPTPRGRG